MIRKLLLAASSLSLLAACAVGPDFKRPPAPDHTTLPMESAGNQHFVQDMDLPGQWWQVFHCPALDRLVAEAVKASPDVKSAQASLRAAREAARAQTGAYFPTATAGISPSRQKTSDVLSPVPNSGANVFSLDTAQVDVSYTPDLFGLNRRSVESLEAQAEAQRFQMEATYLTLTSNVVVAAIQEASLRAQIASAERIIRIESDLLNGFKKQASLGQIAISDEATQEAALAQAEQAVPTLQKQLAQQRDELTALLGRLPGNEPAETFTLADLHLPDSLPVSIPGKLVEQRPDIRIAEENLHAASAQLGISIANRLPSLTLDANAGSTALALGKLFTPGTGFFALSANLTGPLFDGNTLLHKERAARDLLDASAEQYRSAVITAFQNVADTLHALHYDALILKAAEHAQQSAAQSLEYNRIQLRLGSSSELAVLTAEQLSLQAEIGLVQAQASQYADTAALFQALGGGWWNRADDAESGRKTR